MRLESAGRSVRFHRLLKPDGFVSLVKHNRPGRVMQMVVLLNEFEKVHALLDGEDGSSADYGAIRYYEDEDVTEGFHIRDTYGIRTFWNLQQNQACHTNPAWQEKMISVKVGTGPAQRKKGVRKRPCK